ncbi:unnamed protein product [Protopolystoma xenopodis]|uniref:Uncharacterized protein n=1 Tax=Protopolystoma xenopodis TaxID=117903 RepID=A0A448XN10_9PLAT|nr:unnamed protein product [Protopolystoma xenopodis]
MVSNCDEVRHTIDESFARLLMRRGQMSRQLRQPELGVVDEMIAEQLESDVVFCVSRPRGLSASKEFSVFYTLHLIPPLDIWTEVQFVAQFWLSNPIIGWLQPATVSSVPSAARRQLERGEWTCKPLLG